VRPNHASSLDHQQEAAADLTAVTEPHAAADTAVDTAVEEAWAEEWEVADVRSSSRTFVILHPLYSLY